MEGLKKFIKSVLLSTILLKFFGSKKLFKFLYKKKLVIFLFHEISNSPSKFYNENNLNIKPNLFDKQIDFISENFKIIHPKNIYKKRNSEPHALITFDDGSKGVFTNALKILERKKCPSIFFINYAPIKNEIFWSGLIIYLCNNYDDFKKIINPNNQKHIIGKEFLYANLDHIEKFFESYDKEKIFKSAKKYYGEFGSVDDLQKTAESNLFCIGNHLYNHYNASLLDQDTLISNYKKNKLNYLKNYYDYFSYPFGQKDTCYNDKTNEILLEIGAQAIFTANPLNFNNNSRIFHRFSIDESFTSDKILLAKLNYRLIRNFFTSIT